MLRKIFVALSVLISVVVLSCGEEKPTEQTISGEVTITTEDGETTKPASPGVGRVGETLENGYYRVTLKQVKREIWSFNGENILVEIENIGNKKTVYVGPFNFSLIAADSRVYEIGASTGVKLDIGQKREFEFAISSLEKGTKLVFQAYEDVISTVPEKGLLLPKGKTIGKPITFDPHLFVFMVLTIEPSPGSNILNTDVIRLSFTNPVDKESVKNITMSGGQVTAAVQYPEKEKVVIWLNNINPGKQILNISKVTDQSGELVKGTTTFQFSVNEDRVPPRIIKHPFQEKWRGYLIDIKPKPESLDSFDLTFNERMDKKSIEVTISPSLNGRTQLEVERLEEMEIIEYFDLSITFRNFVTVATIRLPQKLAFGTKYTLLVKGKDLAGNQLEEKIEFETYTPDLTPPRINDAQCSPKNGATGIDPAGYWEGITIAFTEPMAEVKVVSTEPEFSFSPELGGNILKLKFLRYMMSNETKYRIILTGKDGAGNALATTEYSFETMKREG